MVLLQQTPLDVIVVPPLLVIFPPLIAEDVVILLAVFVVKVANEALVVKLI